jgi:hypothetical protein
MGPTINKAKASVDKMLHHALLSQHPHEVVQAANVETTNDDGKEKGQTWRFAATISCAATNISWAISFLIAVVVIVAFVSHSKQQSKQWWSAYSPGPTSTLTSRRDILRSLLLNHSVSSRKSLDTARTPQHAALTWLASDDQAMWASASAETIIHRYVLAVVSYGFYKDCLLLPNSKFCDCHNPLNVTCPSGAFYHAINISIGKKKNICQNANQMIQ